jgi:uncharacterized C2H2 Zn-finger protein
MIAMERCPECATEFDARRVLVRSGLPMFFNALTPRKVEMPVRCPNCRHVFAGQQVRLFGFVSPDGLRWVLLGVLALCLVLVFVLPPR